MPEINFPYTQVQLTEQINRIPNNYGLLEEMNLFPTEGSASTLVEIRFEDGVINVLPMVERGGPPSEAARGTGNAFYLEIPHFPHRDLITPDDLQNWLRLVGRQLQPKSMDDEVAKRLFDIRRKHAITREYIRMGALKLLIKDGAGQTIYNLASVFNIVRPTIFFDLTNADADIIAKCEAVLDHIQSNLKGETMSGIEILVSSSFFNKFVQHPKVEKYYINWSAAQALANPQRDYRGNNWGRVFPFSELLFREYKGVAPLKGGSEAFVEAGKGYAFPAGTMNAFATYDGPAYHIDFVNDPGMEIYVSPLMLDHGAGVELMTQSNPLAVTRRPDLTVLVDEAAS